MLIPPLLTSQVSVHTSAQPLLKPNQQVLEASPLVSSQPPPVKPLAEPTHHSILGLPVVHLSLSLVNPPWVQLSQRGILPMAETICQSTQTFAGRISLFRSNWEALTSEPWVLQTVSEGYHIPLMFVPHQHLPPTNPHLFTEDSVILREDIQSLQQKQAMSGPSLNEGLLLQHVYSSQERWRSETCHQSETSEQICEIRAFQNGGATHSQGSPETERLDGQGGPERCLFHGPNSPPTSQPAPLQVEGKDILFQLPSLQFCTAPRVFTKILKPCVEMLRSLGIRLVIYMDDMLLMASSKQTLTEHVQLTMYLLENLGFIINSKKSILSPSQEIEFLGMLLNSITMEIKLPGEKIKKIRQEAHYLLAIKQPSAQQLSQLLGKLNATTPALQMAPSFAAHF